MDKTQVYELWSKTGLLEGIEDQFLAKQVAVVMESQRLVNENPEYGTPYFRRASIPLLRRLFGDLPICDLVSVQAAGEFSPKLEYLDKYGRIQLVESATKTKMLGVVLQGIANEGKNLQEEADYVASTAFELAKAINREVLSDLAYVTQSQQFGAGTRNFEHKWRSNLHLLDHIRICSGRVGRMGANWLVVSSDLFEELKGTSELNQIDLVPKEGLSYVGMLSNKWRLYVDTYSDNNVLLGFKGGPLDSGYIYAPLNFGMILDHGGLVARYAKKLIDANYYATITVNGYSTKKENNNEQVLA